MSKHTPGPWAAKEERLNASPIGGRLYSVAGRSPEVLAHGTEVRIAKVNRLPWAGDKRDEEAEANARLIAAAPELLTACELLTRWNDNDLGTGALEDAIAAARAAIAKSGEPK